MAPEAAKTSAGLRAIEGLGSINGDEANKGFMEEIGGVNAGAVGIAGIFL